MNNVSRHILEINHQAAKLVFDLGNVIEAVAHAVAEAIDWIGCSSATGYRNLACRMDPIHATPPVPAAEPAAPACA